jgi:hypothetical protein
VTGDATGDATGGAAITADVAKSAINASHRGPDLTQFPVAKFGVAKFRISGP